MKYTISLLLFFCFLAARILAAPEVNYVGKTVLIKTTKQGSTCIRIEKSVPKIGSLNKTSPDNCLYKVTAGEAAGTVCFESVAEPGLFLHNSGHHLALIKGAGRDGTFRVVPALKGSQGNALQSYSYPQFHCVITDKENLDFSREIKDPKKATFYIEEFIAPK